MFLADMVNQEWEVEISPSSRYHTEDELVGSASRFRSARRRADLREPSDRSHPFLRRNLGQVPVCFSIVRPLLRNPKENLRCGLGRTHFHL